MGAMLNDIMAANMVNEVVFWDERRERYVPYDDVIPVDCDVLVLDWLIDEDEEENDNQDIRLLVNDWKILED